MKTTHDPRPIPGAIDGTPWKVKTMTPTVENSTRVHGYTDHTKHEMAVPAAPSSRARWVALHELGHAKFTPANSKPSAILKKNAPATGVDLQVMEDLRINSRLAHAHLLDIPRDDVETLAAVALDWAKAFERPEARPDLLEVMTLAQLQAGHVSKYSRSLHLDGLPIGQEHKFTVAGFLSSVAKLAEQKGRNRDADLALASELASKANEIAKTAAAALVPKRPKYADPLPHKRVGPAAALLRRLLEAEKDLARTPSTEPGHIRPKLRRCNDVQWGKLLTLPTLPLTETSPALAAHRQKINAPVGPRLRNIRRLLTDGRAFARTITKPQKGGTVLIDTSGSMHLRPEDVHAVLAKIPAATVAIYSGQGKDGAVSIIAKAGRIAAAHTIKERISEVGGGNIVDGPALAWLGHQAEPRLWVCDGAVTGCNDNMSGVLDLEAEALRRKARIARFDSLPDLAEHLQKEAAR